MLYPACYCDLMDCLNILNKLLLTCVFTNVQPVIMTITVMSQVRVHNFNKNTV